jgi:hypothetical protein
VRDDGKGIDATIEDEECTVCGWDMREAYHPEATAPPA